MIALTWILSASAGVYSFPTTAADAPHFYPTAYFDQGGGTDWSCGGVTYLGHRGSDFGVGGFAGMDAGRTVVAASGGTVLEVNDGEFDRCITGDCAGGGGFGNYVKMLHADGTETIYGHLKTWSVAVWEGQVVGCGEVLGEVGSSGYSTGPHLHVEMRSASVAFDPFWGACGSAVSQWTAQGAYLGLPTVACGALPTCEPIDTLHCGAVHSARNDGPGSTSEHSNYGPCSEYSYSGPEVVYAFTATVDEPVTLDLTGLDDDLDLLVMDSTACDGTDCVAASTHPMTSDESITFSALAGTTYQVVVDGWGGAVSDFELALSCTEGLALSQTPMAASEEVTFTVTGASPGETVFVLRSSAMGATCPDLLGGRCLDLAPPVSVIGSAVGDGSGTATLLRTLPPTLPDGLSVHTQAAVVRGVGGAASLVSNPVDTVTGSAGPDAEFCAGLLDGLWCSGDDLVTCSGDEVAAWSPCAAGCITMPYGTPDACADLPDG
jgi:hypothetical protein